MVFEIVLLLGKTTSILGICLIRRVSGGRQKPFTTHVSESFKLSCSPPHRPHHLAHDRPRARRPAAALAQLSVKQRLRASDSP